MFIGATLLPEPVPTEPIALMSDEEAMAYKLTRNPEALTFENILLEPLGYFLVRSHAHPAYAATACVATTSLLLSSSSRS